MRTQSLTRDVPESKVEGMQKKLAEKGHAQQNECSDNTGKKQSSPPTPDPHDSDRVASQAEKHANAPLCTKHTYQSGARGAQLPGCAKEAQCEHGDVAV